MLENKELLDTSYISNVNSNSIMLSKVELYGGLLECASVDASL